MKARIFKLACVFLLLAVISIVGTAQSPLPMPALTVGNLQVSEEPRTLSNELTARESGTLAVTYTIGAANKNRPWDGNQVKFSVSSGPTSLALKIQSVNDPSHCIVSQDQYSVTCNFGYTIPGTSTRTLTLTLIHEVPVDYFRVSLRSYGVLVWIYSYMLNPYPYQTNSLSDPSFETAGLPGWKLREAKRACNKTGKPPVSFDGNCALRLMPGSQAKYAFQLPSTGKLDKYDLYWISAQAKAAPASIDAKLIVMVRTQSTLYPAFKYVWKLPQGTGEYSRWSVNVPVEYFSYFVEIKLKGSTLGKIQFDNFEIYPIYWDEL